MFKKDIKRIAQLIYEGKLKPGDLDEDLLRAVAEYLFDAVKSNMNFEGSVAGDDPKQVEHLKENVYVFSGFKNYQQLYETTQMLHDEEGKIRSKSDFMKDVLIINATYNRNYLATEFEHATNSTRMYAKWQTIQDEEEALPLLKYKTLGDASVRPEHAALDGIIKKVGDPFWNTYYPPNGWGCRCSVEQLAEGEESEVAISDLPPVPPMFRNNVGKDGVIFPDTHPYFETSKSIDKKVRSTVKDILK